MVDERKAGPVKTDPAETEPAGKPASSPAAAVREAIEGIRGGRSGGSGSPEGTPQPKSPRQFIEERMRDLDKKKDG